MDTNWCLHCTKPVSTRHSSGRPAPYCSRACEQAAYSSPPTLASSSGGQPIPHLLRAYPASPTFAHPHAHAAKPRTASFASTASTASTTSRDEWARSLGGRGSLSPHNPNSSSSSSVSSEDHHPNGVAAGRAPGRPRAASNAYKPVSAPLHPAASSYIYQERVAASVGATGAAYATFTADLRAALPPTPPKSAESVRRAAVIPRTVAEQQAEDWETTPAPSDDESAFYGRGHDRAYYYKAAKAPPTRYAYMDPSSYTPAEPRESRDRYPAPQVQAQAQYYAQQPPQGHRQSMSRSKPIRTVGTDEGPGVKRFVGGFGDEEEGTYGHHANVQGKMQPAVVPVQAPMVGVRSRVVVEPERGRGRERRR